MSGNTRSVQRSKLLGAAAAIDAEVIDSLESVSVDLRLETLPVDGPRFNRLCQQQTILKLARELTSELRMTLWRLP